MSEPNRERIRLWVEALRSGQYKQGQGRLTIVERDGEYDCCLGVACKVAIANGVPVPTYELPTTMPHARQYGGLLGQLPEVVVEWYGLPDFNPRLEGVGIPGGAAGYYPPRCSNANDGYGLSFAEIADAIEATYLTPEAVTP